MATSPTPPPHIPNFRDVVALPLQKYAAEISLTEIGRLAQEQLIAFRGKIFGQHFRAFVVNPLADSTLAKKRKHHRDLRVMISTTEYVGSIRVAMQQLNKTTMQWRIGHAQNKLARDTIHGQPRSDTPMWKVAMWNEKGTTKRPGQRFGGIPARPHWGPHLNEMRRLSPAVRNRIRRLVTARLRRSMGA